MLNIKGGDTDFTTLFQFFCARYLYVTQNKVDLIMLNSAYSKALLKCLVFVQPITN